ncbi:MAG: acetate--CoA ligase family protein [Candidatus Iainarchaeum archaeon]|uniref:Acetate--CoA ligase family protein n=1 Tax=Candidatus Iainarchaeum sp. TaxID=3101447 RepID=A0A7T9DJI3_9ARCH|nr:MAG: acetate--CoA ligase family protein [Candidatus Diapherotrites archaeon]
MAPKKKHSAKKTPHIKPLHPHPEAKATPAIHPLHPTQMDFFDTLTLCKKYHIPTLPTVRVKDETQLGIALEQFGFPVAMKAIGKKLIHKSDVGGVKLNVMNNHYALEVFDHFKKIPHMESVAVQPMKKGLEIIIGGKRDPQFGPMVLVGLGGVYTEVFKDTAMRVCPITRLDAHAMLEELKIYPILMGARGQKPINMRQLEETLLNVSQFMLKNEQIKELDLNPVMATHAEVVAVDVRAIL